MTWASGRPFAAGFSGAAGGWSAGWARPGVTRQATRAGPGREQCRRAVAATVERFGRLDVLLCSAGISMRAAFDGSDLDAMERVIRVNFHGTLYATYFALPHVKRARGSLVAVSSLTGK